MNFDSGSYVYAGGLVSEIERGSVEKSYNRGMISGSEGLRCGAITYKRYHTASIDDCYYLDTSATYAEGLSESIAGRMNNELMKQMSAFTGFDSENVWYVDPHCSYPYPQLRSTPQVRIVSLSVEQLPTKLQYEAGDELDVTGGTLSIEYENGTILSIPMTDDMVKISGYDMNLAGEQTVTVSYCGAETSYQINVSDVPVQEVLIEKTDIALELYGTYQINATVLPDNAVDKTLTWSSSNPSVASVDQSGMVTAINQGSAIISVTSSNGITARCNVTVCLPLQRITIEESEIALRKNDTYQLHVTVLPLNASAVALSWDSSDPYVASVDQHGLVTANEEGRAVISAVSVNGLRASCEVIVSDHCTSLQFDRPYMRIITGGTVQLDIRQYPAASADEIIWISTDESIATVEDGLVRTKSAGTAAIVAVTGNGKYAVCNITVAGKTKLVNSVKNWKAVVASISYKGDGNADITLGKDGKCMGFQLQYSTKSNMKNSTTINVRGTSVPIDGLQMGKKYYFRTRVYDEIGGATYYGKWSAVKSMRKMYY